MASWLSAGGFLCWGQIDGIVRFLVFGSNRRYRLFYLAFGSNQSEILENTHNMRESVGIRKRKGAFLPKVHFKMYPIKWTRKIQLYTQTVRLSPFRVQVIFVFITNGWRFNCLTPFLHTVLYPHQISVLLIV